MKYNWRKWNRILHRDAGYFFFGMTLIYAISGIALNHIDNWNPSYSVVNKSVIWDSPNSGAPINKEVVLSFLDVYGERKNYKKHYFPDSTRLKIFLKNGNVDIDLTDGNGVLEKLNRRPVLYHVNFLHYNPKRIWTWFSDLFCLALILIAVTGLFIVRGKNGITRRGAVLTGLGIAIPLILLLAFLG